MDILINTITALGVAIIGVWLSYKLVVKFSEDKAIKQKKAIIVEVSLVHKQFINWLKILINEFNEPLQEKYSGAPFISTQLIENLIAELSGTDQIVSEDLRQLMIGLRSKNEVLANIEKERNKYIKIWLCESESIEWDEKHKTKQSIEFYTAHLLKEVIDITFHTSKFKEEKYSFQFRNYSIEDKISVVCKYCDIGYEESFWSKVIQR